MENYILMAIATVGITEWLKSFEWIALRKKLYPIIPFVLSLAVSATEYRVEVGIGSTLLTWLFVFSIATLAYDGILQTVKKWVESKQAKW
jgi:hypothetical protein